MDLDIAGTNDCVSLAVASLTSEKIESSAYLLGNAVEAAFSRGGFMYHVNSKMTTKEGGNGRGDGIAGSVFTVRLEDRAWVRPNGYIKWSSHLTLLMGERAILHPYMSIRRFLIQHKGCSAGQYKALLKICPKAEWDLMYSESQEAITSALRQNFINQHLCGEDAAILFNQA